MSKIPDSLRSMVFEGEGNPETIHNELLMYLVDAIEEHNAILDDTIHHELHEMKQSMAQIAGHTRFIGSSSAE